VIIASLLLLAFPLAQPARLPTPTFRLWSCALPGSLLDSSGTSFAAFSPPTPSTPASKPGVGGTHALLVVAINARAITGCLSYVIHWVLPNVGRGSIIADKEVFKVASKPPILELRPAASHMGRVLPDQLGVVAYPAAALIARTKFFNSCRIKEPYLPEPMANKLGGIENPPPSRSNVSCHVLSNTLPVTEHGNFPLWVRVVEKMRVLSFLIVQVVDISTLVCPFLRHPGKLVVPNHRSHTSGFWLIARASSNLASNLIVELDNELLDLVLLNHSPSQVVVGRVNEVWALVPKATKLAHGVLSAQPILSLLPVAILALVLFACGFTLIYKVVVILSHNCLWSVKVVILDEANTKVGTLRQLHVPKTETLLAKLR